MLPKRDLKRMPTEGIAAIDAAGMNPRKWFPSFGQKFEYTGLASKYLPGWPGKRSSECGSGWSYNCIVGQPQDDDLRILRALPWGLGQPTSGQYDIAEGGWKAFGSQGQYPNSETPLGYAPHTTERCQARYLLVVVVTKEDAKFADTTKNLILDIKIVHRGDDARRSQQVTILTKIIFSAYFICYFI